MKNMASAGLRPYGRHAQPVHDAPDRGHVPVPQLISVDVELSSICKNRCLMCPRDAITRRHGLMSEETFSSLLDFLKDSRCLLTFSGMGDPLENPSLPRFIRMASDAGHETGVVVHPASLAAAGGMERLLEYAPHSITVSFPSIRPKIFQRLCPVIPMESALKQVLMLKKMAAKTVGIRVSGIVTRLNMDEEEKYRKFWKKKGIPSWITRCHSRGGSLKRTELLPDSGRRGIEHGLCSLFFFHTFITWNGDVLACCHDLEGNTALGTIRELETFQNLLTLKKRMAQRHPCPHFRLCSRCDEPLRNISLPKIPHTGDSDARRRFFRKLGASSGRTGRGVEQ